MKNRPPPAPARTTAPATQLWRNLALVLGASTIALAILLVRVSNALDSLAAATVRPAASDTAALPRELTPFAALGSDMAEDYRLGHRGWTPAQLQAFLDGARSTYDGRGVPMNDDALRLRDEFGRRMQATPGADRP